MPLACLRPPIDAACLSAPALAPSPVPASSRVFALARLQSRLCPFPPPVAPSTVPASSSRTSDGSCWSGVSCGSFSSPGWSVRLSSDLAVCMDRAMG